MTAMPEAKLSREAQICYALIALPSDYDCWRAREKHGDKQTLLKEIMGNLKASTDNCMKLIDAVLRGGSELICEECSCRKSLDLAVWTEQSQISAADRKKLKILFE
jgi:5'-methylthioadenosine phosphorylase